MKVLSLFDGISCGRLALDKLGIEKDKIHELMGYKFLRYQTEIAGMPVELIKSSTKLTTSEMTEYQQQIEVWGQTMGWGWDY